MLTAKRRETIRHLLRECGTLREGERLLIVCDPTTRALASAFLEEGRKVAPEAELLEIPLARFHGQEPPERAARAMLRADLIASLCRFSLAHTAARVEAGRRAARFLSMPCYSWELLDDPALLADYKGQAPLARRVSDLFTRGARARVWTRAGTDVSLQIAGRAGNCCPGFVERPGDLGSPPDIEANVSPVEEGSEGRIIVDGSITCPELGLLSSPVEMTLTGGRVTRVESRDAGQVRVLEGLLGGLDSPRRVLAECGLGLNPKASLTGTMLTDEGALGTAHFGFGSNDTVGGKNKADFHLDFVFRNAGLSVDGIVVIEEGELKL